MSSSSGCCTVVVGFHLTGAYFWGSAYIMSILKNHTRAYFQVTGRSYFRGNRIFPRVREGFFMRNTKQKQETARLLGST